jgi:hypothetical protein
MRTAKAYEMHNYRWYCPNCETINDAALVDLDQVNTCWKCKEEVTLEKHI